MNFKRTATIAVGEAGERTNYLLNHGGENLYWVVRVDKVGVGFVNLHIGQFTSKEEALEAAQRHFAEQPAQINPPAS